MWFESAGILLIAISTCLMLILAYLHRRKPPTFRNISGFSQLRIAISRATEDGKRLHVSLGRGGLTTPQSASTLAGLSALLPLAEITSSNDQPTIATSGEAATVILSQDALKAINRSTARRLYDTTTGRLTGLTPFSYAAGTLSIIRSENVFVNVLIGNIGIEAGLITDVAERQVAFILAASDSLPAQAIFYASTQNPLIGEELFAARAYLKAGALHAASLSVQDILRWVTVAVILLGAILKLAGIM